MANRRAFSMDVVNTDKFLDMPATTQLLYFHMGMRADDDGFISSPKQITRLIGCSDDDLRILALKGFIIPFDDGVVVITDWNVNNRIRTDRKQPTKHTDKLKALENIGGTYSINTKLNVISNQMATKWQPDDNQVATKWQPDDNQVTTKWQPDDNQTDTYSLETDSVHNGDILETEWRQVGDSLETERRQNGDRLETEQGQNGDELQNQPTAAKQIPTESHTRAGTPGKKDIDTFFEQIWSLYPSKKGKGRVSDTQKKRLFKIGLDEITRAVERYKEGLEKDSWRKPQNGSTFFNSGYVDYLDSNYMQQDTEKNPEDNTNKPVTEEDRKWFEECERKRQERLELIKQGVITEETEGGIIWGG